MARKLPIDQKVENFFIDQYILIDRQILLFFNQGAYQNWKIDRKNQISRHERLHGCQLFIDGGPLFNDGGFYYIEPIIVLYVCVYFLLIWRKPSSTNLSVSNWSANQWGVLFSIWQRFQFMKELKVGSEKCWN